MDRILNYIGYSFRNGFLLNRIEDLKHNNLETKDCFQHLLIVDISNDTYEVPCFLKLDAITRKLNRYTELCVPIINNNTHGVIPRRMVGTIIRDFQNSKIPGIQTVVTSKGDIYHGCPGLILDKDFNPLLVLTCVITEGKVVKYRCRISNSVFEHKDRLIEKAIFKTFIPTLTTEFANNEPLYEGIFIGDINLLVKPTVPSPNKDINEDIHKFLIDNIDGIL